MQNFAIPLRLEYDGTEHLAPMWHSMHLYITLYKEGCRFGSVQEVEREPFTLGLENYIKSKLIERKKVEHITHKI